MLCCALKIVTKIIFEIEPAIRWQLVKRVDLPFARLECGADVFLRIIIQLYAARFQRGHSELVKRFIAEIARVFAVEPMWFIRIEGCRAAADVLQIENSNDFADVEFFTV